MLYTGGVGPLQRRCRRTEHLYPDKKTTLETDRQTDRRTNALQGKFELEAETSTLRWSILEQPLRRSVVLSDNCLCSGSTLRFCASVTLLWIIFCHVSILHQLLQIWTDAWTHSCCSVFSTSTAYELLALPARRPVVETFWIGLWNATRWAFSCHSLLPFYECAHALNSFQM